MLYRQIEKILDSSKFFTDFDQHLAEERSNIGFHGLNLSAKSLLIARTFLTRGSSIVFISADDNRAEEFTDDLELLVGSENSRFLPDYEVLPYEERSPHFSIRAQRIETLARAVSVKPAIYNLSVRSFLRKIVTPDLFRKNLVLLNKGMQLSPEKLVSDLVGLGYQNEFQVSQIGDLARRGGIIDVMGPGFRKPLRIEFFGDEIESIRFFSIETQKSTGEELEKAHLLPVREFSLHDIETTDKIWNKIHQDGFYEGIEMDISLLFPKIDCFLKFLDPAKTVIFWDEFQYFNLTQRELLTETVEFYQKMKKKYQSRTLPQPKDLFLDEESVLDILKKYKNVFLNTAFQEITQAEINMECPFTSQNTLHGNLEMLEDELKAKLSENYKIIIQSDNSSQSKRMQDLLPGFQDKITFSIGVLHKGFNLTDVRLAIYTDHEIFSRYKRKRKNVRFAPGEALIDYESLKPGDYIVHIDHGIGIYGGLKKLTVEGNTIECLIINYAENDCVYVPTYQLSLISKFISQEGVLPVIHKLGSKKWEASRSKAQKQIELIAEDIVRLYAERKVRAGIAMESDSLWQQEMEDSFIYEDTPDQTKATLEIKEDMEQDTPMERLLCGDVGFGKTEVAIRAAFKAVLSGWQVVVLVPTTLLAEQHYLVFRERLAQYPVEIAMFSRFRSRSQINKDIALLAQGKIDIAIGTHRLFSKDISINKLGLLIVDEEHRFGVRHKEKLRKLKSNVDTLYMSATPIPRTMYMALSRLKDLSLIRTSPKERLPIRTVIVPYDQEVIKDAISREVDRGGQVFFIHNRVQTIDTIAAELRNLLPGVTFGIGHGQLPEKLLEQVTLDFAHHQFDVLIATTIIESGIDIPNVNTIIINRADTFGLAQLYQIRGRVGRSNRRAYAYLIIPPQLSEDARKRLETLIEYESLGSGYQIAMRDMELRGVGALLGTKQHGIINTIGFNHYTRLLEDAVKKLRSGRDQIRQETEKTEEHVRLQLESDFYFPEYYISDEQERLNIYRRMLNFEDEQEFHKLKTELEDRFGKLPEQAENSLLYYHLRLMIRKSGLESFRLKQNVAIIEFSSNKLPSREKLEKFVQHFAYPIQFSSTKNLKISVELSRKNDLQRSETINKSLEIVDFLTH